ncbi:hypothetical protein [Actinoplanes auranticolor]|uniref:hypothetical protein n=1 Tax=Actinoplanes auranticolor TaxID=47988 RepID=UPI001BB309F3|nr:hypothetical protein [Actinoplanes auranticolor]
MRKLWILAGAALAVLLGGSSAATPSAVEMLDAPQLVAFGDPAAPSRGLVLSHVTEVVTVPAEQCTSFAAPASIPVTARLGESVAYGSSLYTIQAIGVADRRGERVWLVARVAVARSGCQGSASLWDFLFLAADGTSHGPAPQGRRGEFTSYEIPAGGWATGLVFFDVPRTAVAGGSVGFRESPFAVSVTAPTPIRPYGLWPVPAVPAAAVPPRGYPRS